eukprot:627395-Alexandrium_andersonii.AAC.1
MCIRDRITGRRARPDTRPPARAEAAAPCRWARRVVGKLAEFQAIAPPSKRRGTDHSLGLLGHAFSRAVGLRVARRRSLRDKLHA